MEEVWKDITLSSLNPNPNAHFQNLTFQDFLSQPFSNRNPNPNQASAVASDLSPTSPPPIALTLNSGNDRFNSLCHSNHVLHNSFMSGTVPPHSLNNVSFDELASAPGIGRKRFPEIDNSGDRRHKRMIKNRESAARSRARRQVNNSRSASGLYEKLIDLPKIKAYTNELELEVTHLTEENARLKRQQQQLCLAAASQVPKRHALHRSSTAPF